jgi:hypothetical protein
MNIRDQHVGWRKAFKDHFFPRRHPVPTAGAKRDFLAIKNDPTPARFHPKEEVIP